MNWIKLRKFWCRWNSLIILILPPVLFAPLPLASKTAEARTAYAILIMAVYWVTEVTDLAVTSLLPLLLFPMLGVAKAGDISLPYFKDVTVLVIGGLLMAIAIERWNVHKRIALKALLILGAQPRRLMFGFMLMTAFISMWITNTATTAMMTPIMEAVLQQLDQDQQKPDVAENDIGLNHNDQEVIAREDDDAISSTHEQELNEQKEVLILHNLPNDDFEKDQMDAAPTDPLTEAEKTKAKLRQERIGKAMMMCICYSANIGGTGTITGTAPQLVLAGSLDKTFENGPGISFLSWFIYACPQMLLLLLISWLYLQIAFFGIKWKHVCFCFRGGKRNKTKGQRIYRIMKKQYEDLGKMTFAEMAVLGHFCLLVVLWLFREPKFIPGWGDAFKKKYVSDATTVIMVVFSLFLFPSEVPSIFSKNRDPTKKQGKLLNWQYAQSKLPWNVVILLGSGMALADACKNSGLSTWLGCRLVGLKSVPDIAVVLVICILITFLTEFTSNTATANILMPVLASLAQSIRVHPFFLMIPATVCASFAFMLPVATPPNAIVFATGRLRIKDMALCGLGMNFIGILVVTFMINTLGRAYYGLGTFPAWAEFVRGENACEPNITTISPRNATLNATAIPTVANTALITTVMSTITSLLSSTSSPVLGTTAGSALNTTLV